MEASYEKFVADKSLANLMELRAKVDPYHPMTETEDVSTMAALTSPTLGVDDARWYLFQLGALMDDAAMERYEELVENPLSGFTNDFNALEYNDAYQMPEERRFITRVVPRSDEQSATSEPTTSAQPAHERGASPLAGL